MPARLNALAYSPLVGGGDSEGKAQQDGQGEAGHGCKGSGCSRGVAGASRKGRRRSKKRRSGDWGRRRHLYSRISPSQSGTPPPQRPPAPVAICCTTSRAPALPARFVAVCWFAGQCAVQWAAAGAVGAAAVVPLWRLPGPSRYYRRRMRPVRRGLAVHLQPHRLAPCQFLRFGLLALGTRMRGVWVSLRQLPEDHGTADRSVCGYTSSGFSHGCCLAPCTLHPRPASGCQRIYLCM